MQYNYHTQELLAQGIDFSTIYNSKQEIVKEMSGFDFNLTDIVQFLKKETNGFKKQFPLAADIDAAIYSIYLKSQSQDGVPGVPLSAKTPVKPSTKVPEASQQESDDIAEWKSNIETLNELITAEAGDTADINEWLDNIETLKMMIEAAGGEDSNLAPGSEGEKYQRGGFLYEIERQGYPEDIKDRLHSANNVKELKEKLIQKYGSLKGITATRKSAETGAFYHVNLERGGYVEVVLNEGNGAIINDLYNQWNNVETEEENKAWVEKVRSTIFGTYGDISIESVLKNFNFDNAPINSFHLKTFKNELKWALNKAGEYAKYEEGGNLGTNGLLHAMTETISAGYVGNITGYDSYKSIDAIKSIAIQILLTEGDREYSIGALNNLLDQATEKFESQKETTAPVDQKFAQGGKLAKPFMLVYLDGRLSGKFMIKKNLYKFVREQVSTGVKKVEIDYGNRIIPTFDTYLIEDGKLIHKGELIQPNIDAEEVERKRQETEKVMNKNLFAKGGEVVIDKKTEKEIPKYEYETKKVSMAWNGIIQQGQYFSAKECLTAIRNQAKTEEELNHYSIITPDKIFHLGSEYKVRYPKYGVGGEIWNTAKITEKSIDGKYTNTWYLTKMDDSTHFFLSNDKDFKGSAYHVGQFRGDPKYNDLVSWLNGKFNIDGKEYVSSKYAQGGEVGENFWRVLNLTDKIYASSKKFKSTEDAQSFIDGFHKRFEKQGYYATADGHKIPPSDVELYIINGDIGDVPF